MQLKRSTSRLIAQPRIFFLRFWNGEIDWLYVHAQRSEWRSEVGRIANGNVRQILRPKIFLRDAQDVGFGDCCNRFLILKDEVLRIPVVLINQEPVQSLARRIEVKDKTIE